MTASLEMATKYYTAIGGRPPVSSPQGDYWPGYFFWAGTYADDTALSFNLRSAANRIGFHPCGTSDDPDYTLFVDEISVLVDVPTAEVLLPTKLLSSFSLQFGANANQVTVEPIGHSAGVGISVLASGSDAQYRAGLLATPQQRFRPLIIPRTIPLKGTTAIIAADQNNITGNVSFVIGVKGMYMAGSVTPNLSCNANGTPATPNGPLPVPPVNMLRY